jgi:hypothetical protein
VELSKPDWPSRDDFTDWECASRDVHAVFGRRKSVEASQVVLPDIKKEGAALASWSSLVPSKTKGLHIVEQVTACDL